MERRVSRKSWTKCVSLVSADELLRTLRQTWECFQKSAERIGSGSSRCLSGKNATLHIVTGVSPVHFAVLLLPKGVQRERLAHNLFIGVVGYTAFPRDRIILVLGHGTRITPIFSEQFQVRKMLRKMWQRICRGQAVYKD